MMEYESHVEFVNLPKVVKKKPQLKIATVKEPVMPPLSVITTAASITSNSMPVLTSEVKDDLDTTMEIDVTEDVMSSPLSAPSLPVVKAIGHMLPQQPSRPSGLATAKPQPKSTSKSVSQSHISGSHRLQVSLS